MKQVTKVYDIYEFNELGDKAKKVAFDIIKDIIVDDRLSFFQDDCYEVLKDVFNLLDVKRVSYDLSFSQGDGLSFTCDNFNSVTINEAIFNDEATPEAVKHNIKKLGDHLQVKTTENKGRYAYAHSSQVSIHLDGFNDDLVKDLLPEYMEDQIQQAYAKQYLRICKQLKDNGYRLYNVTMEEVAEMAIDNGYEFYQDGSQF
jgi:F0F1-type ATP synthase gamma subunit